MRLSYPLLFLITLSTYSSAFAALTAVSLTNPAGSGANAPTGPVASVEAFSETQLFSSLGGGNLGTNSITRTLTFIGTCVSVEIDVTLATAAGNLFEDTNGLDRGFGAWDGTGGDTAINTNAEILTFTASTPVITYTNPPGTYVTSVTGDLDFGFDAFNLVNNGGTAPSVNWTATNSAATGTVTSTSGTAGFATPSGAFPATSSSLTISRNSAVSTGWLWINDVSLTLTGNLNIIKVPEPSRSILLLAGMACLGLRRRR